MAIDPELISVKKVSDIPIVDFTDLQAGNLFAYDGDGNLKRIPADQIIDISKSGFKGIAKTSTIPEMTGDWFYTVYEAGTYTNFLDVSSNPIEVTSGDLDGNYVYIYVKDGVASKVTKEMVGVSETYFKENQSIVLRKETVAEIQVNIDFEEDTLAIVTNEPNPNNNGIYKKIGGVGSGGWEKTNFINPLHHKKITDTTANDTESLAIGGGHTSIFQDELGTGQGHTAFGFEAGLGIGNCWATTLVGWKAGRTLSNKSVVNSWTGLIGNTGNTFVGYNVGSVANGALDNTIVGTSAGQNITNPMDTCLFGIWAGKFMSAGCEDSGFGHYSLGFLVGVGGRDNLDSTTTNPADADYCWGHRVAAFGNLSGTFDNGGNELFHVKKCSYIGANTSGTQYAINENVFGYDGQGRGTNTVVIGNSEIKETTIHGTIRAVTLFTVATLPTGTTGERAFVTDATSTVFSANAVGGGSNRMPVYFDGNAWRIG